MVLRRSGTDTRNSWRLTGVRSSLPGHVCRIADSLGCRLGKFLLDFMQLMLRLQCMWRAYGSEDRRTLGISRLRA